MQTTSSKIVKYYIFLSLDFRIFKTSEIVSA